MKRALAAAALCLLSLPAWAQSNVFPYALNQLAVDQQVSAGSVSNFTFAAPNNALTSLAVTNTGASTAWAMLIDAASLPANGAIASCTNAAAARPCVMWCSPIAAGSTIRRDWTSPIAFQTGIVAALSSTACPSLTAAATGFFAGAAL